eukprot:2367057-Rhodomonas_salina.1
MQQIQDELREVKGRIRNLKCDLDDLKEMQRKAANVEHSELEVLYNEQLVELGKNKNRLRDLLGPQGYTGSGAAGAALPSHNDSTAAAGDSATARAGDDVKVEAGAKVKYESEVMESVAIANDVDITIEDRGELKTKKQEGTAQDPVLIEDDDSVQVDHASGTTGVNGAAMVKEDLAVSDGTESAQGGAAVEKPTQDAETMSKRSNVRGSCESVGESERVMRQEIIPKRDDVCGTASTQQLCGAADGRDTVEKKSTSSDSEARTSVRAESNKNRRADGVGREGDAGRQSEGGSVTVSATGTESVATRSSEMQCASCCEGAALQRQAAQPGGVIQVCAKEGKEAEECGREMDGESGTQSESRGMATTSREQAGKMSSSEEDQALRPSSVQVGGGVAEESAGQIDATQDTGHGGPPPHVVGASGERGLQELGESRKEHQGHFDSHHWKKDSWDAEHSEEEPSGCDIDGRRGGAEGEKEGGDAGMEVGVPMDAEKRGGSTAGSVGEGDREHNEDLERELEQGSSGTAPLSMDSKAGRDRGSTIESSVHAVHEQPEHGASSKGKSPARAAEVRCFERASNVAAVSNGDDGQWEDDHEDGQSEAAAGEIAREAVEWEDAVEESAMSEQIGVGVGARTQSEDTDRDAEDPIEFARVFMQSLKASCTGNAPLQRSTRETWCRQFEEAAMEENRTMLIKLVRKVKNMLWCRVMTDEFYQNREIELKLKDKIKKITSSSDAGEALRFFATRAIKPTTWSSKVSDKDFAKLTGGRSRAAQEGQGSAL